MNHSSVFNSNVLNYPSIEFLDDGYIKSLLCIWDTIYRIVPESYCPNDSPEIKLAMQEGLIRNINLQKNDLNSAAEDLLNMLSNSFIPAGLDGYETINLHRDKIDSRIYPYLQELSSKVSGEWLSLPKPIVNGYMIFLANSICQNRKMPKITDNPDIFAIMTYFENEACFDEYVYNKNAEEYYTSIIVPTFIPAGIERTDMEVVLRFREQTAAGRAEFRDALTSFTDELKEISDGDYARELTQEFANKLRKSKLNILEFCKTLIPSYLTIGVPTAISTLGLLGINDQFSWTNVLKTFFISSVSAISDGYSKCKTWTSETASYCLDLETTFEDGVGRIDAPRYDRFFEQFIND